MSVLFIGIEEYREIAAALDRARANVVPWSKLKDIASWAAPFKDVIRLKDRPPGFERPDSEHIMLGTYRAAISFEEQPAGIFKHLSVSSARKGMVPGPEVMQMVCEAFGFSETLCRLIADPRTKPASIPRPFHVWVEEFDPDHMAINVIEMEMV